MQAVDLGVVDPIRPVQAGWEDRVTRILAASLVSDGGDNQPQIIRGAIRTISLQHWESIIGRIEALDHIDFGERLKGLLPQLEELVDGQVHSPGMHPRAGESVAQFITARLQDLLTHRTEHLATLCDLIWDIGDEVDQPTLRAGIAHWITSQIPTTFGPFADLIQRQRKQIADTMITVICDHLRRTERSHYCWIVQGYARWLEREIGSFSTRLKERLILNPRRLLLDLANQIITARYDSNKEAFRDEFISILKNWLLTIYTQERRDLIIDALIPDVPPTLFSLLKALAQLHSSPRVDPRTNADFISRRVAEEINASSTLSQALQALGSTLRDRIEHAIRHSPKHHVRFALNLHDALDHTRRLKNYVVGTIRQKLPTPPKYIEFLAIEGRHSMRRLSGAVGPNLDVVEIWRTSAAPFLLTKIEEGNLAARLRTFCRDQLARLADAPTAEDYVPSLYEELRNIVDDLAKQTLKECAKSHWLLKLVSLEGDNRPSTKMDALSLGSSEAMTERMRPFWSILRFIAHPTTARLDRVALTSDAVAISSPHVGRWASRWSLLHLENLILSGRITSHLYDIFTPLLESAATSPADTDLGDHNDCDLPTTQALYRCTRDALILLYGSDCQQDPSPLLPTIRPSQSLPILSLAMGKRRSEEISLADLLREQESQQMLASTVMAKLRQLQLRKAFTTWCLRPRMVIPTHNRRDKFAQAVTALIEERVKKLLVVQLPPIGRLVIPWIQYKVVRGLADELVHDRLPAVIEDPVLQHALIHFMLKSAHAMLDPEC